MRRGKAKARPPTRAEHQTALMQLQERKNAIAEAVEKLRAAQNHLDQVGGYLFVSMQALRTANGELVCDVLKVQGDAYCRLLEDAMPNLRAALKVLGRGDALDELEAQP